MDEKIPTDTEILEELITIVESSPAGESRRFVLDFIKEKRSPRTEFPTLEEVMNESDICLQLIAKRAAKYGEAWKYARLTSLIDYVIMKYHRVNTMASDPILNKDKLETDLRDMINYGYFSLIKLREENEKNSTGDIPSE